MSCLIRGLSGFRHDINDVAVLQNASSKTFRICVSILQGYGRALQGEQWEMLEEFCPSNPTPFHMNIAANTAMRWQDKDTKKKLELPEDVEEVVTQHFEKLEEKHGADYVNVVFGCLSASCEGLRWE